MSRGTTILKNDLLSEKDERSLLLFKKYSTSIPIINTVFSQSVWRKLWEKKPLLREGVDEVASLVGFKETLKVLQLLRVGVDILAAEEGLVRPTTTSATVVGFGVQ